MIKANESVTIGDDSSELSAREVQIIYIGAELQRMYDTIDRLSEVETNESIEDTKWLLKQAIHNWKGAQ